MSFKKHFGSYLQLKCMTLYKKIINKTSMFHTIILILCSGSRQCIKTVNVDGHTIPEGAQVFFPIQFLHHDPKYWTDPEKYDPDRYLILYKPNYYTIFPQNLATPWNPIIMYAHVNFYMCMLIGLLLKLCTEGKNVPIAVDAALELLLHQTEPWNKISSQQDF